MVRPDQPEWFSKEEKKLADEWAQSDSELSIIDYILANASKEFLEYYEIGREMIEKLPVSKYPIYYNYGSYTKVYFSRNISDWRLIKTEEELRRAWDNGNQYLREAYKTYEEARSVWKKEYKNK